MLLKNHTRHTVSNKLTVNSNEWSEVGRGADVGFKVGDWDGGRGTVLPEQNKNDREHDRDTDGEQSGEGMINAAEDRLLEGHRAMLFCGWHVSPGVVGTVG